MTAASIRIHIDHPHERLKGSSSSVDTRAVHVCLNSEDEEAAFKTLSHAYSLLRDWFADNTEVLNGGVPAEDVKLYIVDAVTSVLYSSITEMGKDIAIEAADRILGDL